MEYIKTIIEWFVEGFKEAFSIYKPVEATQKPQNAPVSPVDTKNSEVPMNIPNVPPVPNPDVLLPWIFGKSLTHNNWHNVRVICDLEKLSYEEKEELCATVWGESEFNTEAKLNNKDKSGKIWSTDWGICQWNDYWHGKEISPSDAVDDPEMAVRLMCSYWKRGESAKEQWIAYKSGRYKQFMYKKL